MLICEVFSLKRLNANYAEKAAPEGMFLELQFHQKHYLSARTSLDALFHPKEQSYCLYSNNAEGNTKAAKSLRTRQVHVNRREKWLGKHSVKRSKGCANPTRIVFLYSIKSDPWGCRRLSIITKICTGVSVIITVHGTDISNNKAARSQGVMEMERGSSGCPVGYGFGGQLEIARFIFGNLQLFW